LHVTLFESGTRLGGALETVQRDGYVIETGADSFLSEKPWALALAERLGLSAEVIGTQAEFRKTLVVRKGRLTQIPEGFSLLAPTFIGPMLKSPLFSPAGKLRIMMEPFIPRRRGDGDESLADFVTRRLGREVLQRVAQPLAGGIYTADPAMLSVAATMPRFVEMERRYGSVIRGLRAAALGHDARTQGTSGARWSLFVSFKSGVRALVDTLQSRLHDSIRYGAKAVALERVESDLGSPGAWRLRFGDGAGLDADAVVCAVPAYAAAPLLKPHCARLATILERIDYASAATVNLAFRESDFPRAPTCFGFVVPAAEKRKIIAGSFSSLKFAGRAPTRMILARVFLGGALQSEMMALDDAAMIAAAREEFAALLGVTARPHFSYVRRWPTAMPQYHVGHLERVAEIETEAGTIAGLAIAGAFLRGVGIPDCIRSGEVAAEAVFSRITSGT
jgi:protoporphyrinogen/coproporphyrinogen III oxidase